MTSRAEPVTHDKSKLWRTLLALVTRQPLFLLGLLVIQFGVVVVAYISPNNVTGALIIALVFDVLWPLIFIGIPALWELVKVLAYLLIAGAMAYLIAQTIGVDSLLAYLIIFGISLLLLGLLVALVQLALIATPGLIVATIVYQATGGTIDALVAFAITTLVVAIVVKLIFDFLLPFLYGFGWTWVASAIVNRLAAGLVVGLSASQVLTETYGSAKEYLFATFELADLVQVFTGLFAMPPLLLPWVFLLSIVFGILALNPGLLYRSRRRVE